MGYNFFLNSGSVLFSISLSIKRTLLKEFPVCKFIEIYLFIYLNLSYFQIVWLQNVLCRFRRNATDTIPNTMIWMVVFIC